MIFGLKVSQPPSRKLTVVRTRSELMYVPGTVRDGELLADRT